MGKHAPTNPPRTLQLRACTCRGLAKKSVYVLPFFPTVLPRGASQLSKDVRVVSCELAIAALVMLNILLKVYATPWTPAFLQLNVTNVT